MKIFSSSDKASDLDQALILSHNTWDDFGIKGTFDLTVSIRGKVTRIGEIKVMDSEKTSGKPQIKDGLGSLPGTFCSLGQSKQYYERIRQLGTELERKILEGLRDCGYNIKIYNQFKDTLQFNSTLIRFSAADQALSFAQDMFSEIMGPPENIAMSFNFSAKLNGFKKKHKLVFSFGGAENSLIPSNINVLVGRNGTGKTQILSELAKAISGYGYQSKEELLNARQEAFSAARPGFGNTIVVSYSAFDMFEIPGKTKLEKDELQKQGHIFGYKYCGLRERVRGDIYKIKSLDEVADEFATAYDATMKKWKKPDIWNKCLRNVLNDPSFSDINREDFVDDFKKLSSGQKIILSILAQILEHIETKSIIIIDEPEMHLHPSLMAAFMHSLTEILKTFQSYAVIATHSPVILQETPSKFVQVLDGTVINPVVRPLDFESFGEEISTLTEKVFKVSLEEANFYSVLRALAKKNLSAEQMQSLFGARLGFTARSFMAEGANGK